MEDLIREAGPAEVRSPIRSWRAVSIIAALALVLGGVVLARGATNTSHSPTAKIVQVDKAKAIIDGAGGAIGQRAGFGAPTPQIQNFISAIVCPILDALASGPLGALIGAILAPIRAFFGCTSI